LGFHPVLDVTIILDTFVFDWDVDPEDPKDSEPLACKEEEARLFVRKHEV